MLSKNTFWSVVLVAITTLFSYGFACAVPLVALAVIAALTLEKLTGMMVIFAAWTLNQLIGFTLLGYPAEMLTVAWGLVIGASGVMAYVAALFLTAKLSKKSLYVKGAAVPLASFVAYEATMFLGGALLGSGLENFTLAIISQIAYVNVIALAALTASYKLFQFIPAGQTAHA